VSATHSFTLLLGILLLQMAQKQQSYQMVFVHLPAHVKCIHINALFHILFHQPPHLGLIPILLCTSAVFLGLELEIWLTFEVAVVADAFYIDTAQSNPSPLILPWHHFLICKQYTMIRTLDNSEKGWGGGGG